MMLKPENVNKGVNSAAYSGHSGYAPIFVDLGFEVNNGMLGMLRDTVLHLCCLLWHKDDDVRLIIGTCGECYHWKTHNYFIHGRPCKTSVSFRPNPAEGFILTYTPNGPCCQFTYVTKDARTVFLNKNITHSVYSWKVYIEYGKEEKNRRIDFWLGSSPSHTLALSDNHTLGFTGGSCGLDFWKIDYEMYYSGLVGVRDANLIITNQNKIFDHSIVIVEVDADTRTMSFFVNGTKIPLCVSNVKVPLHLGMSGDFHNNQQSFTSLLFQHLPFPTFSTVMCTF